MTYYKRYHEENGSLKHALLRIFTLYTTKDTLFQVKHWGELWKKNLSSCHLQKCHLLVRLTNCSLQHKLCPKYLSTRSWNNERHPSFLPCQLKVQVEEKSQLQELRRCLWPIVFMKKTISVMVAILMLHESKHIAQSICCAKACRLCFACTCNCFRKTSARDTVGGSWPIA